jgi:hypothetical protein
MSKVVSLRLPEPLAERLHLQSRMRQQPESAIAARLVDEGLRMGEHPGIIFRDGPTGRRAVVIGGPDVWEVVRGVRSALGDQVLDRHTMSERASEALGIAAHQVDVAWDYYVRWREEIDGRIALAERLEADALAHLHDSTATAS